MAQYQSPEIRGLYNKYHKEAQAKGMDKKNQIEKYIQKYVKPTTECTDVPDNAYNDGAIADGAVRFLTNCHSDKPFFLAVGFKKPHLPFCAPKSIGIYIIVKRCLWLPTGRKRWGVRSLPIINVVNCNCTPIFPLLFLFRILKM